MVEIGSVVGGALQSAIAAPNVKSEAPAEAVERFEQLQNAPAGEAGPHSTALADPQSIAPADGAEPAGLEIAPAAKDTAGDTILRSLDRMSKGFDGTVDQISQAINSVKPGETLNSTDLLKLQFQLTQMTVQQEVTGKVTGKATQSLETFLKNQ